MCIRVVHLAAVQCREYFPRLHFGLLASSFNIFDDINKDVWQATKKWCSPIIQGVSSIEAVNYLFVPRITMCRMECFSDHPAKDTM